MIQEIDQHFSAENSLDNTLLSPENSHSNGKTTAEIHNDLPPIAPDAPVPPEREDVGREDDDGKLETVDENPPSSDIHVGSIADDESLEGGSNENQQQARLIDNITEDRIFADSAQVGKSSSKTITDPYIKMENLHTQVEDKTSTRKPKPNILSIQNFRMPPLYRFHRNNYSSTPADQGK